jgi:hypothetical protein
MTGLQPGGKRPSENTEMPDGIGRLAVRRKTILVAWDEPLVSWRKQILLLSPLGGSGTSPIDSLD